MTKIYYFIILILFSFLSITMQAAIEQKEFTRNPFGKPFSIIESIISSDDLISGLKDGAIVLKLKGIIWDKNDPEAVIEVMQISKKVKIGDTIESIFVSNITKKELTLKVEDKTYILEIGKEFQL